MSHFNTMFSGLKPKGRKALALLLSLLMITSTAAPAFADLFAFLDVEEPQQEQTAEQAQYSAGVLETVGDTYRVTVSYEAEAEIPADAQLEVSEILPGEAEYDAYYKASMDKLRLDDAGFVRLFDISILYGGEKIQPKADVITKIYCSEFDTMDDMSGLSVLHFKGEEEEQAAPVNPGDGVGGGEGFRAAPELPEEAKGVSLEMEKDIAAFEDEFAGLTAVGKGEDESIAEAETADAEELEAEIMNGTPVVDEAAGKAIEFVTDGFSVYAVVGDIDPTSRMTINFYGKDTATPLATVYVKNDDDLEQVTKIIFDPGAGTLAPGEIFRGWVIGEIAPKGTTPTMPEYTVDMASTEGTLKTIEDIRTWAAAFDVNGENKITEGDVVNIRAAIYKTYVVTYLDNDGIAQSADSVLIMPNDNSSYYEYTSS